MRILPLAAVLALAISAPAFAQEKASAPAGENGKTVQVTKVFRYLDNFLEVPEAKRNKIRVTYVLLKDGKPAPNLHPALIDGDNRIPLPLAPGSAQFLRLPTLDQLRRKLPLHVDVPEGAKMGLNIDIESTVPPAQEIDAREVATSINQVGGVLQSAVGALAFLAPRFTKAGFPKAGSGVAITASGKEVPLPLSQKGVPIYEPGAIKDAVKLRFASRPAKITLLPSDAK